MNLNKIGFAVGVLAFVFAIPIAIVANLLTPKVQEWYSTTSYNRAKKRLALLQKQLAEADWVFTRGELVVFRYFSILLSTLCLGVSITIDLVIGLTVHFSREILGKTSAPRRDLVIFMGLGVLMGAFVYFVGLWGTYSLGRLRRLHSQKGRQEIEEEITRLRGVVAD